MPPRNEFVWIKLRDGEGYWHMGMLTDQGWWITGKGKWQTGDKPQFHKSVAGWAPWR